MTFDNKDESMIKHFEQLAEEFKGLDGVEIMGIKETDFNAIIFDTETTGIVNPRIIEAAWIETDIFNNSLMFGTPFTKRYNPGIPSSLGALRVHNILDTELENCKKSIH
jgi:hypothetical protein